MGLCVLLTNNTLSERAGTELYVRDVATALLERGHRPIAFSTRLGRVADELRAASVPVVDRLDQLSFRPDVIHGHHHVDTMIALLALPGVPAISYCHGWIPWEETPLKFPRIRRYVAVDELCRDRLLVEHGIANEQVVVILNFVDLQRFAPRKPLPQRPVRALVFSNALTEERGIAEIRSACSQAGIEVETTGLSSSGATARPEKLLGRYDVVFAKGRAALEALAVGCAVVLCDASGSGPIVTSGEFERLRNLNFGWRALNRPITSAVIEAELARYDPVDAAEVSRQVRSTAGREPAVDRLLQLYQTVIAEHASAPVDPVEESRAASRYVQWLAPRTVDMYDLHEAVLRARADTASSRQECERLRGLLAAADRERERIRQELELRSQTPPQAPHLVSPVRPFLRRLFHAAARPLK